MSEQDPTAAVIIIGAEVLSGKVQDANGPHLIRALRDRGIALLEIRVIGDDVDIIADAVRAMSAKADFVFTTGGIGPTHDDVTVEGVAKAFGTRVTLEPRIVALLKERWGENVEPVKLRLAEVPEGAEVQLEEGEFVPVIRYQNVWVFPGVPGLMRQCFDRMSDALPRSALHTDALMLQVSESSIAGALYDIQAAFPEVAIGSYPRFSAGRWRVKVTVDGRKRHQVDAAIRAIRDRLEPGWLIEEP